MYDPTKNFLCKKGWLVVECIALMFENLKIKIDIFGIDNIRLF